MISVDQDLHKVISKLESWENSKNLREFKFVKLDIMALYPSINPPNAITKVMKFLDNSIVASNYLKELNCSRDRMVEALEFVLNNDFVRVGDQLFMQKTGLPIESLLSGLLSDFYLIEIQVELTHCLNKAGVDFFWIFR